MESARIRARLERQYVLIPVPGDLDGAGTPRLSRRLETIDANTDVVLDMSAVHHCSPDGWELLCETTRRLAAADGSLTLSRLRPEVRAELRASGHAGDLKVRRRDR